MVPIRDSRAASNALLAAAEGPIRWFARSRTSRASTRPVKHTRIVVTRYGGPEVLQVLEEECPEPAPGQVRVRVLAAGVGMPDIMAREGLRVSEHREHPDR